MARGNIRNTEPVEHWHLDKKIPIAIIVAMFVQVAVVVTWANRISFDVEAMKQDLNRLEAAAKDRDRKFEELSALQADMRHLVTSVNRLERILENAINSNKRAMNDEPKQKAQQ